MQAFATASAQGAAAVTKASETRVAPGGCGNGCHFFGLQAPSKAAPEIKVAPSCGGCPGSHFFGLMAPSKAAPEIKVAPQSPPNAPLFGSSTSTAPKYAAVDAYMYFMTYDDAWLASESED